ncbi:MULTISPECIES: FTR1 family protein [unclassified Colwellia]|uniref:cytochrome c/FTR1 family iron permease n=1 Tax=unclassified Colwellia TaxID=196834 RepID=UPI0015F3B47B|nr:MULTISPECIES: FTR1 family protein [unclassified Colwellia]MBA6379821.1 FTR1 family protein [Colwellia sp. BRX10-7]MBA6386839.1 FTR1 family protein [Colwellia sp. BRX10-2]MBA6401563.1 FTR1 family protein [Colwellia sp. BRX10-5]MBA6405191.1 FTR1 family protein [Colwellia sp. BRX10-1]
MTYYLSRYFQKLMTFSMRSLKRKFIHVFFVIGYLISTQTSASSDTEGLRQLLQLTEYISVDYASAISNGKVIDQGEYQEMLDFSNIIAERSVREPGEQAMIKLSKSLLSAVQAKKTLVEIQMLTSELKNLLINNSPQLSLPTSLLSASRVKQLFQNNCASCHGVTGKGDGKLARQLSPQPTNFNERTRALDRSILGLYDVVTGGLDGTAMPSFKSLTAKQRWSLAFYTGSLAFVFDEKRQENNALELSLAELVQYSPNELYRAKTDLEKGFVEQLRSNPEELFSATKAPLTIARDQLKKALAAYKNNDVILAQQFAVSAYLDGFELVENNLDAYDSSLRKMIEFNLLGLRNEINNEEGSGDFAVSVSAILLQIEQAEFLLNDSVISDTALFSASFIILLREGLEALLVVLVLFTILVRSNKKEAIKYLHFGWIAALIAGGLTWLVAQKLVTISGASRETMEGVAALLAAIVLFYVGFWMHSKTQADQWQRYVQQNINKSLKSGALWGISGLAFIAVYREVFETVLFYQSLLTQTNPSQQFVLFSGFGAAAAMLVVVAWLMIKYSIKLPIARFFSITTYLLLALSFILAGKAITALQEAAIISITRFPIDFHFAWLGINSTWQGITTQAFILFFSSALFFKPWLKKTSRVDE